MHVFAIAAILAIGFMIGVPYKVAIGPALIEKGVLDPKELQELCEELRHVEEQDDVLCIGSPDFSIWVNRT